VLAYSIGPISCAALRRLQPNIYRPFKLPYHHFFCFIAFYICNLIVYWTGWSVVWKMMLVIIFGYLQMLIQQLRRNKTKLDWDFFKGIWLLPYLITLTLIAYLGNFGGIRVIPFGMDFVAILVLSALIYWFALRVIWFEKPQAAIKLAS